MTPRRCQNPPPIRVSWMGGIIISCSADPEEILAMGVKPSRIVLVDGIRIAFEVTGNNLTNMIMCGAFARSGVLSLEATLKAIRENLAGRLCENQPSGCLELRL